MTLKLAKKCKNKNNYHSCNLLSKFSMLLSLATLLMDPMALQYCLFIVTFFSVDMAFTNAANSLPLYMAILSACQSTINKNNQSIS